MEKNLYIDASHPDETRIVLKSKSNIEEYESENTNSLNIKSNIYLGKVSRVEPSLQAAFVNYGRERHGFLAFNDIQSDYYQIPTEDKKELQKTEEKIREDLKEKTEDNEIKTPESFKDDLNVNNNINERVGEDKNSNTNQSEKIREKLKNRYGVRKYRIQEVIKPGQVILVQV
ncbi:MAG: ribonuclease E/G, partial [Pelagibacteraceae bacterium]|nr:ribonuclease E/G [Pelagibacteraceae bacterium]